ncbi:patatin-like phospholipase family protein [uncultured Cohaesibacter sp.]|uniref:patatin-like phospholipase family protein n=1 Tax=uncultured Cohaesibacter sp. TaxID=1002546 RepID=UPI0029C6EF8B|nr:patatin-like phospholipase family protein [uncultured Cohaesibacter sp.]
MSEKTVAIAFGGGGARGLAHIWIMEALDELGITPVALSGCSIGALAAASYGSGMTGADLRRYVLDLFGNRGEVLSRLWQNRPKSFSELFASPNPVGNWVQFDPEWLAEAFLPPDIKSDFSEFLMPVSMSASNYFTGEEVVFRSGKVMTAMAASMAIPALFRPVLFEGEVLIDGGCVNPMPIDHVRPHADIIIAVDVVGVPQKPADGKVGSFEMGFGATQILMQTIQREKMRHDKVDLLVQPLISSFRPLDFLKANDILAVSEPCKDEVKRSLSILMEA